MIQEQNNTDHHHIDSDDNLINTDNNITKDNDNIIIQKKNDNIITINTDEKEELINIMKGNNDEELYDDEYFYLNLFTIIIDDFQNYPNFNHIETISNIEEFIILSFRDFYEINLIYEFEEENIKSNTIELFGELFVNNNKENCFLLINEKIIELRRFIKLSEIFDDSYLITFWPLTLHVKLILKKSKSSIDLSFMFYEISTISSKTIFDNLNNVKITKMNYMFYNCSSLKQLPNISEINTSNVTDMSYMFYNCSSLTSMSDISRWDTRNVVDISHIFQNCELLTSIPDISQWKADNIKEMDDIFRMIFLIIANHYLVYQIYQNGILRKIIKKIICLKAVHY